MIVTENTTYLDTRKRIYDVFSCEKGHINYVYQNEKIDKCICGSKTFLYHGQKNLPIVVTKEL